MKVLQLFVHFSPEQFKELMEKYQDEGALKFALSRHVSKAIEQEVELAKDEKLINQLEKVQL